MEWTQGLFDQLKKEYATAVQENKEEFEFNGTPLFTQFAKYLIEYLTTKFG